MEVAMKKKRILTDKLDITGCSEGLDNSCLPLIGLAYKFSLLPIVLLLGMASATAAPLDLSQSQYPLFVGSINKANVLLILDNSNSMDEDPFGTAAACSAIDQCGSASDYSKSQISRLAAKSLVSAYTNRINLGLMAYQQNAQILKYLHNSPYDASFDSTLYDPSFSGPRESSTKKYRIPNPSYPGHYVYYNVALPYYANSEDNSYCYTGDDPIFPTSTHRDSYRCFTSKTSETDGIVQPTPSGGIKFTETGFGWGGTLSTASYGMSDSDIAQGIYNYGDITTNHYVGRAWYANSSPGKGYLHVPISLLDATQAEKLDYKLRRAVLSGATQPINPLSPLQNAGLTPIEGTFITAKDYFLGALTGSTTAIVNQGGSSTLAALPNSCGKNFAVLLTDGLPSTASNGTAVTNPTTALTAAAAAATALRTSTAGVETYVIGFALPYGVNPATLDTIAAAGGGSTTAYSASNLTSLNATFNTIFADILTKTGSAASVATNSTNLKTESRVFQAKFSSADWSGQLLQYKLNDLINSEWDTGSKINSQTPNSRVIITKGATGGIPFRWSTTNLTSSQQTYLNQNASGVADGLGSRRVDYLRGDDTNELNGTFRVRSVSKLGDIVNSNPWYVGPPSAGYSDVDHPGYTAFRNGASLRKPVVYVGGNDGMLHGVDASLDFSTVPAGAPTTTAGNEVLAYVPSTVYSNLSKLTGLTYNQSQNHKYFVDGSPMAADAYLGSSWYSTLIGSLGAGGKGYYALNITDPSSLTGFIESSAASILLWEFTNNDDSDVGYSFNNPPANANGQAKQIVKMANGKWAVILGNGYSSGVYSPNPSPTPGKAVLYILFIEDGMDGTWSTSDYVKITADAPASISDDNGLSTPVPFDSDGDGYVDTVYAGDLKGNMWKFLVGPNAGDVTVTATPSTWKLALSTAGCTNNCTPLFSAKDSSNNAQPITWPPEVTLHPGNGMMVLFGTGKYLESTDNASTGVQTFYGIHDEGVTVSGRSALTPQSITTTTVGASTFRTMSVGCGGASQPACPTLSKGWYTDLPTSGERITGVPKLDSGTIFFNTFIPSAGQCSSGGTGWLMALDYLTGSLPAGRIFDTNSDVVINTSDTIVSGLQVGAALGGTTLIKSATPGGAGAGVSSLVTGQLVTNVLNLGLGSRGRITWREIVQ
jgi:type IV pilus assembly protein PilY1